MKLRNQMLIIIAAMVMCFVVIHYLISQNILLASFNKIEQQNTQQNVKRALNALANELSNLDTTCRDWAWWDETYLFVQGKNDKYIKNNVSDRAYSDLRLNLIIYLNSSGDIVYGKTINQKRVNDIRKLPAFLSANHLLASNLPKPYGITGIINSHEGAMLISAVPILNSEGKGTVSGILIMGRYLNTGVIERLTQTTILSLDFFEVNGTTASPEIKRVAPYLKGGKILVKPVNEKNIAGYAMLQDIYGEQGLIMRTEMPRNIYIQGKKTIDYFYYMILFFGLAIALIIMVIIEKRVFSRLFGIIFGVSNINGDFSKRLQVTGNDELTILAQEINGMLNSLEQSHYRLQESEKQYKQIFDEAVSANYISTPQGKILLCNPTFATMFGFDSVEQALSGNLQEFIPDNYHDKYIEIIKEQKKMEGYEFELYRRNGEKFIAEGNVVGRFNDNGELFQIQGYFFDITKRKQAESEITYLSFHDKLTGLYNRTFFDEEFNRLNTERQLPLSIIVGDVNGLKLVNDALGHLEGDKLLVESAAILLKSCRKEDIISRWGGDEFVILLPQTDTAAGLAICNRIMKACEQSDFEPLQLSISTGLATKFKPDEDIRGVLKVAEERMYRNKFVSNRCGHNALIMSLQKNFWKKGYESQAHAERLEKTLIKMAQTIGLSKNEINDITILAVIHDIGKISIPKKILDKNGTLTSDEWEIVKKHSETGYRIARSSPELASVADAVLAHHERWNGSGYPLGIKGEEIPLMSRMLAIAEAYDVMTHERSYSKILDKQEAVMELRRCSGTQFDPELVKIFIQIVTEN